MALLQCRCGNGCIDDVFYEFMVYFQRGCVLSCDKAVNLFLKMSAMPGFGVYVE